MGLLFRVGLFVVVVLLNELCLIVDLLRYAITLFPMLDWAY